QQAKADEGAGRVRRSGFGRFVGHGRQDTGAPFRTRPAPASAPARLRPWPWLFVVAASAASSWHPPAKAGRAGWGGVLSGSARTVDTPSQPPLPSHGEGQEQS